MCNDIGYSSVQVCNVRRVNMGIIYSIEDDTDIAFIQLTIYRTITIYIQ